MSAGLHPCLAPPARLPRGPIRETVSGGPEGGGELLAQGFPPPCG